MFEHLEQIDRELFLVINSSHSEFMDLVMWEFSKDWPTVLVSLLFLFFFYRVYHLKRRLALVLGIGLVLSCTDFSTNLIKHRVKRYRPSHNLEIGPSVHVVNDYKGGTYGFFSSHAANAFGLVTYFVCIAGQMKWKWRFLMFLYPLMVGYSRVYLGVHYPVDIAIGALDGLIFGSLVYWIVSRHFIKFGDERA